MNISLTPELEHFVAKKVKSGKYQTASEVVREALRLLEARDELYQVRLAELRRDIEEGLSSGKAAPFDSDGLKARVRKAFADRKPRTPR